MPVTIIVINCCVMRKKIFLFILLLVNVSVTVAQEDADVKSLNTRINVWLGDVTLQRDSTGQLASAKNESFLDYVHKGFIRSKIPVNDVKGLDEYMMYGLNNTPRVVFMGRDNLPSSPTENDFIISIDVFDVGKEEGRMYIFPRISFCSSYAWFKLSLKRLTDGSTVTSVKFQVSRLSESSSDLEQSIRIGAAYYSRQLITSLYPLYGEFLNKEELTKDGSDRFVDINLGGNDNVWEGLTFDICKKGRVVKGRLLSTSLGKCVVQKVEKDRSIVRVKRTGLRDIKKAIDNNETLIVRSCASCE